MFTSAPSCREAAEDDHPHVKSLLDPDLIHDPNDLQRQHVLPQVISSLSERTTINDQDNI